MPDNVKDLIRAAQAAEIRGDKGQAIEYLRKAAALYETVGNIPRAQQMLRHAQRLSGNNATSGDRIREVTGFNGQPKSTAQRSRLDRHSEERNPASNLANSSSHSRLTLLRAANTNALGPPEKDTSSIATRQLSSPTEFVGREDAFAQLNFAQQHHRGHEHSSVILLVGPPGSGKSALLRALQSRGEGSYVDAADGDLTALAGGSILIDFQQAASATWKDPPRFWRELGRSQRVIAARGEIPKPTFALQTTNARLPLYATAELAKSVGAWLPIWLLEQVTFVIPLRPQNADELKTIGESVAEQLKVKVSTEVLAEISAVAAKSQRGAHELVSLLRRIPSGEVKVEPSRRRPIKKPKDR